MMVRGMKNATKDPEIIKFGKLCPFSWHVWLKKKLVLVELENRYCSNPLIGIQIAIPGEKNDRDS